MVLNMKKSIIVVVEILIVLIAGGVYFVKEVMPNVKNKIASQNLISTKQYQGMVEVQIDNRINFAVVFNQEGLIYHIFYFEPLSTCIREVSIPSSKSLEEEVFLIIEKLYDTSMIQSNSSFLFTYYDTVPNSFSSSIEKAFHKYQIIAQVREENSTLYEKANSLKLSGSDKKVLLYTFDFYSKDVLSSMEDNAFDFDQKRSVELSNTVYMKLEKYVRDHHIQELDRNQKNLLIENVAGDKNELFYPDTNSWFIVSGGKITAYIEFTRQDITYGYCYQGAIDLKKEGEC